MDAKIRCANIYKKLFALMGSFTLINKGKSNNFIAIKVPRPLIRMIANMYLLEEDAVEDITDGLEEPIVYKDDCLLNTLTFIYSKLDSKKGEENECRMFDSQSWQKNPLGQIIVLAQVF